MIHIKELWREHPLTQAGKVELVPTEWLWTYRGADVSPGADLVDGTPVDMDMLWENILTEGLCHPLIMRIGLRSKTFRLEAGNHRIQVFHTHGISEIPLTVEVKDECGPHLVDVRTDATHNFPAPNGFLITEKTDDYMKPSDVFVELRGIV